MSYEKIVLYVDSRFLSPYAMSVFVTLTEKKIPFQIEKIDLSKRENLLPGYVKLSLTRRVPTLIHGGFQLTESSAITEYLDEQYPPPDYPGVYPVEINSKATARQVQAWIRSDLSSLRQERSTEVVFIRKCDSALTESAQTDADKLIDIADSLVKNGSPNIFGDWCLADTDLALMLSRLVHNGDDVPTKLIDYARYQWERPSVQLWVNQVQAL